MNQLKGQNLLKRLNLFGNNSRCFSSVPSWASIHPDDLGKSNKPHKLSNFVNGEWKGSNEYWNLVDPLNGKDNFIHMPDTKISELEPFIKSINNCPKTGLHNPFKNPERYNMYGEVCFKVAKELSKPEVLDFFVKSIQKVMPKSDTQARNEVIVSHRFIQNFCSDNVRFMAQGFTVAGDHLGQMTNGYRFPFGSCALVAPFNFPFEIPVLQMMGALFMGNKLLIKGSEKTSFVIEEYIRLLLHCGMPKDDLNLIHCHGETMQHLILNSNIRLTQFTGSSVVAEKLSKLTHGKVKIEDAGYDWKILGPDVPKTQQQLDFIAYTSDQDAYAMSGQKCSAQSMLIMHENYTKTNFLERLKELASTRSLEKTTISPLLSVTNDQIKEHISKLLKLPGSKVLFGGELKTTEKHSIPKQYGSYSPTAVFVPLESILATKDSLKLCTTEIFGPFQVVTSYKDNEVDKIIEICEGMSHHLTAAVVSNDQPFLHKILGNTVNGTTYAGLRARTTGAPANHWFGPSGDPRGAGIGTPEAIRLVWSSHREIVTDYLIPDSPTLPAQS